MASAVSKDACEHLKHSYGVSDQKRALVLNGIDTQQFEKSKNNSLTKASLGLTDNDFVIGNVGNLRKEKNQELLIKALATLQYSPRGIRIVLVGDGPRRPNIQKLASDLGVEDRVIFLGTRNDVPYLYGLFDIYCLPSRYEGLPLTLLEAMAARVPVIGTNVLGIREVIKHRENGLLVPDNDPETLARAILELINDSDQRRRYVETACNHVAERYNIRNFVRNYESLFERMLENSKLDQKIAL
jgi:glycosyltransferase involved in cell wall biosynthesis